MPNGDVYFAHPSREELPWSRWKLSHRKAGQEQFVEHSGRRETFEELLQGKAQSLSQRARQAAAAAPPFPRGGRQASRRRLS